MATMRPTSIAGSCLIVAGLFLGAAAAEPQEKKAEKKGTLVEVQLQDNSRVKLELQEVVPVYNDETRLAFTKKMEPKLSQITWFEVPIVPSAKRGPQLREIRIADEPIRYRDLEEGVEYLFYPVVLVPFDGFTSSWYWQGTRLSGVSRGEGAPRPVSIPISDIKVVRFSKDSQ